VIFVDTNVFVLALRYPRDPNATANADFLELIRNRGDGVTSVVNVLETCGVLSFNLNRQQLLALYAYFGRRFSVRVIPEPSTASLVTASAEEVLDYIARKLSFGDALVARAVESTVPDATAFVSWDARHFQDKISIAALNPTEFLRSA
jgi:predicted nucleic acid-binding protein